MQIVINIPDEVYNLCATDKYFVYNESEIIRKAIKNGVLLPKGHGRLIDADTLDKDFSKCACGDDCNFLICPVYNQKVIIEADKTENEGHDE